MGVTEQTFYRWRKAYGGMGTEQLRELKRLQKENERLRRAVSDLTLDKLILAEAAKGNFRARRGGGGASSGCAGPSGSRSGVPAGCWAGTARRSGICSVAGLTKSAWWPT